MSELLVIAIVALLFLGPEKLPDAAKKLSKGIREFRQQGRELQRTLHDDTELGDVVRDLQSALRGEDPPDRPPVPYNQPAADSEEPGAEAIDGAKKDPYLVAAAEAEEAPLPPAEPVEVEIRKGRRPSPAPATPAADPPSSESDSGGEPGPH